MASRAQRSKGKRIPLRDKLAALEPKFGYCPDCGDRIHNRGAHAEACPGRVYRRPEPCPHMVVQAGAFNVRRPCSWPRGHEGPCG